jgi:aconitate hydratase
MARVRSSAATPPRDARCTSASTAVSHDITYVGIIQTRAGLRLGVSRCPYVLTNCHNSLCAGGGTINEDDHRFGLSAAKRFGGIYVPANLAVIHQYAREELARCGGMVLGSDSHTRYGALGTMGVGEGGPELVKQLLGGTWDIADPRVVLVHVTGAPRRGVGRSTWPSRVRASKNGLLKNSAGSSPAPASPRLAATTASDDVMTTETDLSFLELADGFRL